MSHKRGNAIRQTLFAGVIALGLSTAAAAQTAAPTTGLGQAWPNATDQSRSPNWHVYVFERDGIRYIQINDRNGTVHVALGHAGDTVFALPVGTDTQRVTVSSSPASNDSTLALYQDDAVSVTAVPQNNGTTQFDVKIECDIAKCTGGKAM
jgi:hypothetical protein